MGGADVWILVDACVDGTKCGTVTHSCDRLIGVRALRVQKCTRTAKFHIGKKEDSPHIQILRSVRVEIGTVVEV
jgi:hypothetical protein